MPVSAFHSCSVFCSSWGKRAINSNNKVVISLTFFQWKAKYPPPQQQLPSRLYPISRLIHIYTNVCLRHCGDAHLYDPYDSMDHASLNMCSVGGGGCWTKGGVLCCKELLYPHQAGDTLLLQTTLPVTMTTNRNFPSTTSPKCFSTQIQPPPPLPSLSTPHPSSYYPPVSSERHLEFGECSSIDRLQMSGARLVTWLIQMSVQLLHRLSRCQLRVSLVPALQ